MAGKFEAAIGKWAQQTEQRIDAVYGRSIELLGEELAKTRPEGGRVPFMTGNLSRSLLASKSGMPRTAEGPFGGGNIGLVAATIKAHETLYIGYQANYARRRNYGFVGRDSLGRLYNEQGAYFVEGAIAEWQKIVKKAVRDIRAGV